MPRWFARCVYGSIYGVLLLIVPQLLSGCVAPVAVGVVAAGAAASSVAVVNMAREQYPDIDFDSPAPVAISYQESQDQVWSAVIDTLQEMNENIEVVDDGSGIIKTCDKNLNDVSWVGKGFGQSTFHYVYSINCKNSQVKVNVTFWEEKMFIAKKEKNIPEGSNMMKHVFFKKLNQKLTVESVEVPPEIS